MDVVLDQYAHLCDFLTTAGAATVPGSVHEVVATLTNIVGASDDQVSRDVVLKITWLD